MAEHSGRAITAEAQTERDPPVPFFTCKHIERAMFRLRRHDCGKDFSPTPAMSSPSTEDTGFSTMPRSPSPPVKS